MKIALITTLILKAAGFVAAAVTALPSRDFSEDFGSNTTESTIERRSGYGHGEGRVICGLYANADYVMIADLSHSLENKDKDRTWDIGPKACNRVTCWDTSAIYICNDNEHQITVTGPEISKATRWIRYHCCGEYSNKEIINGQQFTPWGWNANVGYGNCRDPPQIRPHMAEGHG
ncbi:hypothetical protein diail_9013, partial [Diaporthe ilicicola]